MVSYPHNPSTLMTFLETETSRTGSLDDLYRAYLLANDSTLTGSLQDMEKAFLVDQLTGVGPGGIGSVQDLWSAYLAANGLPSFEAFIEAGGFVSNFLDNPTFGTTGNANRDDWDALSFGSGDTGVTVGAPTLFTSSQNVCNFKFDPVANVSTTGLQQSKAFEAGDYTFRMKFHKLSGAIGSGVSWRIDGSTSGIIFNLNSATTGSTVQVDQDFTCVNEALTLRVSTRTNAVMQLEWGEPEIVLQ